MLSRTFEGCLSLFALFRVEETKSFGKTLKSSKLYTSLITEVRTHILGLTKPKTVNVMKKVRIRFPGCEIETSWTTQ